MNQENLNYLQNTLKYHGFGEGLYTELEKNMSSGVSQFMLTHYEEFKGGKVQYNLHFNKGQQQERVFLNKYDALLTKPDGREFEQTFYFDKGHAFTKMEAYNLLDGRSVNKDFEKEDGAKYNAWVKLDFERRTETNNYQMRRFHENYGYDVIKALEKFPIGELLNDQQKEALIKSLQKGNLQEVGFENNGVSEKRFVAADPEFKGLRIYDQSMKEITTELKNGRQLNVLQKNRVRSEKGLGI